MRACVYTSMWMALFDIVKLKCLKIVSYCSFFKDSALIFDPRGPLDLNRRCNVTYHVMSSLLRSQTDFWSTKILPAIRGSIFPPQPRKMSLSMCVCGGGLKRSVLTVLSVYSSTSTLKQLMLFINRNLERSSLTIRPWKEALGQGLCKNE